MQGGLFRLREVIQDRKPVVQSCFGNRRSVCPVSCRGQHHGDRAYSGKARIVPKPSSFACLFMSRPVFTGSLFGFMPYRKIRSPNIIMFLTASSTHSSRSALQQTVKTFPRKDGRRPFGKGIAGSFALRNPRASFCLEKSNRIMKNLDFLLEAIPSGKPSFHN